MDGKGIEGLHGERRFEQIMFFDAAHLLPVVFELFLVQLFHELLVGMCLLQGGECIGEPQGCGGFHVAELLQGVVMSLQGGDAGQVGCN